MKYIIALFGASGSGKDTVKDKVIEAYPNINPIIRLTTRPMREGEAQNKPYAFIKHETLQKMVLDDTDAFFELEEQREWFYGTHKKSSFKSKKDSCKCEDEYYIGCYSLASLEMLYQGVSYDKDFEIVPIKIGVTDKERLFRQLSREVNPDCYEICRRFMADAKDYDMEPEFCYYTVNNNDDLEECMKELDTILASEVFLTLTEYDIACKCHSAG